MRRLSIAVLCGLLAGCSRAPSEAPDAATDDAAADDAFVRPDTGPRPDAGLTLTPAPEANLMHAFPPIDLAAGAERLDLCQAWTLNNDDPIYVDSVTMDAGPGWHHSNWMWVPDTQYPGDDGTFPCDARSFNELDAGLHGGGVFFAQSTQATHEVQSFETGAAYMIVPHARIIGAIHVFNLTPDPVSSGITFTVHGLASTDVVTLLHGLALDNRNIALAPRATTTIDMTCNLAVATRAHRLDNHLYYVLPHYHGLATGFQLFVVGGPSDGTLVYGTSTGIGDPLGGTIDPPFDLTGAMGLRLACTYENPGDSAVNWGLHRTDEMCTVLAYVDGPQEFAGGSNGAAVTSTLADGTTEELSSCIAIAIAH